MEDDNLARTARCYIFDGDVASEPLAQRLRQNHPRLIVQAVSSAGASNERLVEMIGEQTAEAQTTGSPLAKKPEVDLLMRLGGTTQIARAIKEVGVKRGDAFVLIVFGEESEVLKFELKEAARWERLQRRPLAADELSRIEKAALLNALRP